MPRIKDITHHRFGTWLVLGRAETRTGPHRNWRCRCVCGVERDVSGANLRGGQSTNCGCQREHATTHGLASRPTTPGRKRHPLYGTWKNMHTRCRPATDYQGDYGKRGIRVCERWSGPDGFPNFLADMGERPAGHSIDRIDCNGDYEPDNCRWATKRWQALNKRRHGPDKLTPEQVRAIRGDARLHREIAADYGVSRAAVSLIKERKTWGHI